MRVLAIDPGYERVGVAVLEKVDGKERLLFSECFQTDAADDLWDRLTQVGMEIARLCSLYQPTHLGIETLFFNKNVKTAIAVSHARGVIIYAAKQAGLSIVELSPQEIKVAVTGHGNSDKVAVTHMVKQLVPESPKTAIDDEYDAIAVGITALAHHRG